MARLSVEERFWKHVAKSEEPDGCWIWTASLMNGYGAFRVDGRTMTAHRFSYIIAHGDPGERDVSHVCETRYSPGDLTYRRCVRPDHLVAPVDPVAMFWRRVVKMPGRNGCWLWGGGITDAGYGALNRDVYGYATAHRFSYAIANGDPGDKHVLHDCDKNYPKGDIQYRRCVRPSHLFLGLHADNSADMSRKNRSNRPKLTASDATEIRRLYRSHSGHTQRSLAKTFGVSLVTIQSVLSRRTFKYAE